MRQTRVLCDYMLDSMITWLDKLERDLTYAYTSGRDFDPSYGWQRGVCGLDPDHLRHTLLSVPCCICKHMHNYSHSKKMHIPSWGGIFLFFVWDALLPPSTDSAGKGQNHDYLTNVISHSPLPWGGTLTTAMADKGESADFTLNTSTTHSLPCRNNNKYKHMHNCSHSKNAHTFLERNLSCLHINTWVRKCTRNPPGCIGSINTFHISHYILQKESCSHTDQSP